MQHIKVASTGSHTPTAAKFNLRNQVSVVLYMGFLFPCRSPKTQVAKREQHRCAVTGIFDCTYVEELDEAGRLGELEGLPLIQSQTQSAYIFPFSLNEDAAHPESVCDLYSIHLMFISFSIVR